MRYIVVFFLLLLILPFEAQVNEDWCLSKCNIVGDEHKNTMIIHEKLMRLKKLGRVDSMEIENLGIDSTLFELTIPLRIGLILNSKSLPVTHSQITNTVKILNKAFRRASLTFVISRLDTIYTDQTIEDLGSNAYEPYNNFSVRYDLKDTISLFLFDNVENLCEQSGNAISCGRKGGFSYILSGLTNNVVMSKYDLEDQKVIVHEFGHFFGLYHTFESQQFGQEKIERVGCYESGDMLCDTPADPSHIYEVHINYSTCEMIGLKEDSSGLEYAPLVNNYMSYYKPCYLKEFSFTNEQILTVIMSSRGNRRLNFAKGFGH